MPWAEGAAVPRTAPGYFGPRPGSTGLEPQLSEQEPPGLGKGAVGVGSWTGMETRRLQFSQKAIKLRSEASGTTATFCTFPLGRLRRGGGESLRPRGAAHSRRAAPSGTGTSSSMGSPGIDIVGPKVQGSLSSLPPALDPSPAARRGWSGWQESLEQAQGSPVAPRCLGALPMGSARRRS